ncbi:hypothetical protein M422DRAFT_198162 [Sphaerobolus stellatus SS14]|nr:hypothetical protein M422DRAFT_198162 [Sphaerobolus stellatus SS14]
MTSTEPSSLTLFFLGATGFVGGQLLIYLSKEFPDLHIVALCRAPVAEKEAKLKAIHPNLSVVEGTLEDDAIIQEQCSNASYVINLASSDHPSSVISILAGLERNSANNLGKPPLYIQVSNIGIVSDNCKGEYIPLEQIPSYTDVDGFSLDDCPPTNMHIETNKAIVAAGTRKENPIRTIIVFPSWIYGVAEGPWQKISTPVRIYISMFKNAGQAGTWGPGHNRICVIHVKDCARAILTVFKAALEGTADEGAEGLYFALSDEPRLDMKTIIGKMGDIMHAQGLLPEGGSKPLPKEALDSLGWSHGWESILGGNYIATGKRLKRLGWEASESKNVSFLDSLVQELDSLVQEPDSLVKLKDYISSISISESESRPKV